MRETLSTVLPDAAAGISLLLMGICGVKLLMRLIAVMRGRECVCTELPKRRFAPACALLAAAAAGLLSRLLLYLLAFVMYRFLAVGSEDIVRSFESLWTHWDARHYLDIAQSGYTAVGDDRFRLVFFPLYPLLVRLLSGASGASLTASAAAISLLCAGAASALMYDLAFMHGGEENALRATAYFLLSPLSVFLCCAYTEALFICLTLLAVCLLRRGRPYAAALCGMLSAFTRMPGVIVSGLMIIALLSKIADKRFSMKALIDCCAQVLIVFCGLFAYWLVNLMVTGDPMTYLTYQRENWYQQPGFFWESASNTMYYFLNVAGESDWLYTWGFQLLCMLVIYLLLAFEAERLPFDLAAYSFVYTAVVLSPTWLLSGARYLYALCTFPLMLAGLRIGRLGHGVLLALHAAMLVIWTHGYTIAGLVL